MCVHCVSACFSSATPHVAADASPRLRLAAAFWAGCLSFAPSVHWFSTRARIPSIIGSQLLQAASACTAATIVARHNCRLLGTSTDQTGDQGQRLRMGWPEWWSQRVVLHMICDVVYWTEYGSLQTQMHALVAFSPRSFPYRCGLFQNCTISACSKLAQYLFLLVHSNLLLKATPCQLRRGWPL